MSEASSTTAVPSAISHSIVASNVPGVRARHLRDTLARWVVWIGGLGVIAALLLLFVYLLSEVAPLFSPAKIEARQSFSVPGPAGRTVYVASEEQAEVGLRVTEAGELVFFDLFSGQVRDQKQLALDGASVASLTEIAPLSAEVAALLTDGRLSLFRHRYRVTYPNDQRLITPEIEYPYGEAPLLFLDGPAKSLAVRSERGTLLAGAVLPDGAIALKSWTVEESLLGDTSISEGEVRRIEPPLKADQILIEPLLTWLYAFDYQAGKIAFYRLGSDAPQLVGTYETGSPVVDAKYLAGGISIVVAQADGRVVQWFPARNAEGEHYLARVREFQLKGEDPITALGVELQRRTFAVGDSSGQVELFYATSGSRVANLQALESEVEHLSFNSRAKYLLAIGKDGQFRGYNIHNEHPEVSFSALWGKVWYESYDDAKFLWQSSAATSDFEPKYSLTPLSFGTLKAAFYAMLFAVPLAVLGAIFTANFMAPEMRQTVKPTVELMEALPTVILGFLAGLWLAPFVETNLPGVFLTLFFLPLSIPLFGYVWLRVPRTIRQRVPPGWEALMLIPVIAVVVTGCFIIAKPVEAVLFAGNMQAWMDRELGIGYDQRNALVVGIAMGIAVIPNIYSIAEDAIFSVPKHLSLGSLALGATQWQTLVGVVLPTASPGIFSAIMIGMGRAVGETMIVLMATGNTAVMDPSIFQGLRTLSANIAVEMPESELGSTHFRLLFLAGLVLFLFTFLFNTLAEVVRQRLRQKYAAI